MPVFEYSGQNADGQAVKGFAHGETLDVVARQLALQGLTVQSLGLAQGYDPVEPDAPAAPVTAPVAGGGVPPLEARSTFDTRVAGQFVHVVPLSALQFFFSQLGTLLDAGINPADGLETLSRQTSSKKLGEILRETKDHVIAGRPISAGLQRYPEVFTPLMMSMVRVGEDGGFLADQCKMLSEYIRRDIELRNMIKRETAMPKLTVIGSIVIILLTNMIIQGIAGASGMSLPVPWVIWGLTAIAIVGGYLFTKLALPQPQVRRSFDDFVLALPGVGGMVHGFAMAKFGRAFGALYKGGVSLPRAVELAADACGNESVRARVRPASQSLKEGVSVSETFAQTGAFSPLVLDMTRTGETTGNMDEMLGKVAEFYEEEGALKAQMAAKIIGVACLLLLAAYVCFVLITFYSSYFGRIGSAGEA